METLLKTLGVIQDQAKVHRIKRDLDLYVKKHSETFCLFNEDLRKFCQFQQQTKSFWRDKEWLRESIRKHVAELFPDHKVGVHPYGSAVIGTALRNADLDVCVSIGKLKENGHVDYAPTGKCGQKLREIIKRFNQIFKESLLDFTVLDRCKVPIIKIKFMAETLEEMDLNVNCLDGVFISYLMHHYTLIDNRFVQLCLLVKSWAKGLGLCDAKDGMLNSHSYQLMVTHYLQCGVYPPILPNLQRLFPEIFNSSRDPAEVTLLSDTLVEPLQLPDMPQNESSIGELLMGFFHYYTDFPWDHHAISIEKGECALRTSLSERSNPPTRIYIPEPYKEEENAARHVRRIDKYWRILDSIKVAALLFLNHLPSLDSLFDPLNFPVAVDEMRPRKQNRQWRDERRQDARSRPEIQTESLYNSNPTHFGGFPLNGGISGQPTYSRSSPNHGELDFLLSRPPPIYVQSFQRLGYPPHPRVFPDPGDISRYPAHPDEHDFFSPLPHSLYSRLGDLVEIPSPPPSVFPPSAQLDELARSLPIPHSLYSSEGQADPRYPPHSRIHPHGPFYPFPELDSQFASPQRFLSHQQPYSEPNPGYLPPHFATNSRPYPGANPPPNFVPSPYRYQ